MNANKTTSSTNSWEPLFVPSPEDLTGIKNHLAYATYLWKKCGNCLIAINTLFQNEEEDVIIRLSAYHYSISLRWAQKNGRAATEAEARKIMDKTCLWLWPLFDAYHLDKHNNELKLTVQAMRLCLTEHLVADNRKKAFKTQFLIGGVVIPLQHTWLIYASFYLILLNPRIAAVGAFYFTSSDDDGKSHSTDTRIDKASNGVSLSYIRARLGCFSVVLNDIGFIHFTPPKRESKTPSPEARTSPIHSFCNDTLRVGMILTHVCLPDLTNFDITADEFFGHHLVKKRTGGL